jgi:MFS family permease
MSEHGLRELLQIHDFRRLWSAQVISDFGDNLTFITLLFVVQRLTGSTVALAGLTIAITLPSLVFGLLSGVYVDRWDRRKVMIASDVLRGLLVLCFVLVQSADAIWIMYTIAFAQASIGTLFNPARGAFLPHIVGTDRLLAANSVSQSSRIVFNLLGTGAAGVLAGLLDDLSVAFVIDSATFLTSAWMVSRIRTTGTAGSPEATAPGRLWQDLFAGFAVIRRSRPLTGVLVTAAVAMLGLGAVNVLLVPLVVEELVISESWFGLLEASQVVGMIISGALVAFLAARLRASTLITVGMAAIGVVIGAISGVQQVWHLMIVLFLAGLSVTPVQSAAATLTQTLVSDEMRGRVGASLSSLVSAANVASMGAAGVVAAAVGVRNVFVLAGAITLAAGLLSWLVFRGADLAPAGRPVEATGEAAG